MKKPREIIDQLSLEDALVVLKALADSDDKLARRIAEIATEYLSEVDPEGVAADVYYDLESLKVEDVWDKAGPSRDGYRDTGEVAEGMIDSVLQSYMEDLDRYQKLNMEDEATNVCMGIIGGLYQFEHESSSEFKDWAVDSSLFFADDTLKKWHTRDVSQEAIDKMRSFIQEHLPEWKQLQHLL